MRRSCDKERLVKQGPGISAAHHPDKFLRKAILPLRWRSFIYLFISTSHTNFAPVTHLSLHSHSGGVQTRSGSGGRAALASPSQGRKNSCNLAVFYWKQKPELAGRINQLSVPTETVALRATLWGHSVLRSPRLGVRRRKGKMSQPLALEHEVNRSTAHLRSSR